MRERRSAGPIQILLVDDNPADAQLVERALGTTRVKIRLSVVPDGFEALNYVRRQGSYADASRPDLILLDLNLPGKDGYEVLRELRGDPEFREIPVLIYTGSATRSDVKLAYALGGNCYVQKPTNLDELMDIASSIESFWLCTALLPW